jgi:hypothetical protein
MVDTSKSCGPGQYPCRKVPYFSDSTQIARFSPSQPASTVNAAGCALQNPLSSGSPCQAGFCLAYNACPYALPFGWCTNVNGYVFKPNRFPTFNNSSCYPATVFMPSWRIEQGMGETNVADVVSLWKSPRAAEISAFRDAIKPALSESIVKAIRPALDSML